MSSPLSNLKKPKKTPFSTVNHGNRSVPFRSTNNTTDDDTLLDDVTSQMASKRLPRVKDAVDTNPKLKKSTSTHKSPKTSTSSTPSDQELMTLMLTRVAQLEQRVQFQSKEISDKDKKIKILEDKLRILKHARDGNSENHGNSIELEKKCLLLQQQIHKMETFLADYGMVWVGEKTDADTEHYIDESFSSEDEAEVWKPGTSVPNEFTVDYDVIFENIKELNALAGEGISKIQHTIDGARLKMPDAIPLTLYANGILMFRGPFRPFTDLTTQLCVRDLMDGYFPSELQNRYPEGVPISVSDKRHTLFKDPRNVESFKGVGQVLGGDTKPSRLVNSNLGKVPNRSKSTDPPHENVTSEIPGPKLTVEQFLNKLPASVVKQGRIIDIRNSLGEALQSDGSGPSKVHLVETEAVQEMKTRMEKDESERPPSSREITTLRIKSDQGDQTFILKMKFSQTIGDVRGHLDELRPSGSPRYQILSTFPKRVYDDLDATLKQCGLVPNATLHLRQVKK